MTNASTVLDHSSTAFLDTCNDHLKSSSYNEKQNRFGI